MIAVEASIRKLAPKLKEHALEDIPPLDADDGPALAFAAYMSPRHRVVRTGRSSEAPRNESPKEKDTPGQGHRTESNKGQGPQE